MFFLQSCSLLLRYEIFIFLPSQYRTLMLWRQKAAGRLSCMQGVALLLHRSYECVW